MRRAFLWISALLSFFSSINASADTFVIVFRSPEATIIAADSKVGSTQGRDGGSACKIHITDEITWATTGVVKEVNGSFDLWTIAESAISTGGSLDSIVSRFESSAVRQLVGMLLSTKIINPRSYEKAIESGYVATAVFIKRQDIRIRYFKVPDASIPDNVEIVRHDCPGAACPTGEITLMMGIHDAIDAEILRHPRIWRDRGLVGALNYLIDIQHAVTPESVGPPVSILRIDKSGTLNWLQKGICE